MGLTVMVDNMSDQCAMMCDNVVPDPWRGSIDHRNHLTDLFDAISDVVYVDDINSKERIYVETDLSSIDYSTYSDYDLLNQSSEDIHSIQDLYTINRIYNIDRSNLSMSQQLKLQERYHVDLENPNSTIQKYYITTEDIAKILDMLMEHDWVDGPICGSNPAKNFASLHNLRITQTDCISILHSLTLADAVVVTPYVIVSKDLNTLGNNLILFNIGANYYELEDGVTIGRFRIYLKIDFTRTTKLGEPIALISFTE